MCVFAMISYFFFLDQIDLYRGALAKEAPAHRKIRGFHIHFDKENRFTTYRANSVWVHVSGGIGSIGLKFRKIADCIAIA